MLKHSRRIVCVLCVLSSAGSIYNIFTGNGDAKGCLLVALCSVAFFLSALKDYKEVLEDKDRTLDIMIRDSIFTSELLRAMEFELTEEQCNRVLSKHYDNLSHSEYFKEGDE